MEIIGAIYQRSDPEEKFERLTVEADNYQTGIAELRSKIPEGWHLANIRVHR